jgi:tetratricopeptide (TPR) repeat protein
MTESPPNEHDTLPPSADGVDAACDRFEAAWRTALTGGPRPRIEDHLADTTEPETGLLLRELILLDLHYRRLLREQPCPEEYHSRFPALSQKWLARKIPGQRADAGDPPFGTGTPPVPTTRLDEGAEPSATPGQTAPFAAAYVPETVAPSLPKDSSTLGQPGGVEVVPGYEVVGILGRGGMGVVYKARQVELDRVVALKMVLAGAQVYPENLQRFGREAKILGRLHHPNIVQVFEVGEAAGHPYFTMEFVGGGSLAGQFGGSPIPPARAAALVETVAQAMHAAHQQGIVHRDLKPANVLLMPDGTPKVTDFGLAKRLDATGQTATGAVLGTPSYMAPEQAGGKAKEAGPAADIYSLGAILYELLAGRPPFKAATAMDTLLQVVSDDPLALRRLQPKVPRDLETICSRCLEKDPQRRYASAADLAEDLRRFQAGEPVAARPVTVPARLWRWARRKPAQACLAAVVLLAGIGLVVGASLFAWQAERGRQRAEEFRRQETKRLGQIEKANDMLRSLFRGLDPEAEAKEGKPLRALLGERLDRAAALLEGESVGDPLTVARLQVVLGETQRNLGYPQRAIVLHTRARQTLEPLLGLDHPDTLASLSELSQSYWADGRYDEAAALHELVLEKRKTLLGPDHPDTLRTMNDLAQTYQDGGQPDKALPLFEQTLEKRKATLGPDDPATLETMHDLASAYQARGQLDKALPLIEQTLTLRRASLGPDHPDTLHSMNMLGATYWQARQLEKAMPLLQQTLQRRSATLGPDHPDTLISMNNLAMAYQARGEFENALPLQEQQLLLQKAKLGNDHPDMLICMNNLANLYVCLGRLNEAIKLHQEVLQKRQQKLRADHPDTLASMNNLAAAYRDAGQLEKAFPLYEQALDKMKAKLEPDHPRRLGCMNSLAVALQQGKQYERALALWRDLLSVQSQKLPAGNVDLAATQAGLARCLLQMDKPVEAASLLRESLAVQVKQQPDAWTTFHSRSLLGGSLLAQKKYSDAEPLLLDGYEGLQQRQARIPFPSRVFVGEASARVVQLYDARGQTDLAKQWRQKHPE